MTLTKYLVYQAFPPSSKGPEWRAVEADGKHGFMEGVTMESIVYSWWAKDAQAAVNMVKKFRNAFPDRLERSTT